MQNEPEKWHLQTWWLNSMNMKLIREEATWYLEIDFGPKTEIDAELANWFLQYLEACYG